MKVLSSPDTAFTSKKVDVSTAGTASHRSIDIYDDNSAMIRSSNVGERGGDDSVTA